MRVKHRKSVYLTDSGELPVSRCPRCNAEFSAATGMGDDNRRIPKPGDWSLCAYCGEFLRYTEGFQVRRATDEELRELKADPSMSELIAIAAEATHLWRNEK